ncbi:FKBP-type peptidyl-prolyl cis-trans isomerase N-terminal domain-containing protein [Pseudomarimonas salicorniae]|uniref:Peptidyl-prolyl cis-trans isomerase n=1 Tax=Pseudomarimonas salicorniae TaxID=2933270 RepID=A0ABT0GL55_9GAMM|nr:FKBP-type peptidyl-prolyl cis-trans isomerase N-terminal domain-containing protein [Lysobacter sp. CAU 1642]MCK7595269.1 FKBP-type peptidyl-prolyl cis-trans isomerase [Lysobacter sp. CAU 1642]
MLRWTVAVLAAMSMSVAIAQDTTSDKGKLSYAIGYEIGRDFNDKQMDVDIATVIRAIQDGHAKRNPAVSEADMRGALEAMQAKMLEQAKSEFERVSNENKSKSDAFLAQNRAKSGVVALPSGIQYRVIEEGTGARPAPTSDVQIHFRGSLHTGQEFASTYTGNQAVSMKVSENPIPGLREVLPLMKQGSRWEIFLPADQAYGNSPRSPVGPNQAVVFDVKLIEVK